MQCRWWAVERILTDSCDSIIGSRVVRAAPLRPVNRGEETDEPREMRCGATSTR